jgi:tartrate dehydrogenase/decarboxylase/D-malate dehydrogenase
MMLDHLGHRDAHDSIMTAIENTLRDGTNLTPDMGGSADTQGLGKAIAASI